MTLFWTAWFLVLPWSRRASHFLPVQRRSIWGIRGARTRSECRWGCRSLRTRTRLAQVFLAREPRRDRWRCLKWDQRKAVVTDVRGSGCMHLWRHVHVNMWEHERRKTSIYRCVKSMSQFVCLHFVFTKFCVAEIIIDWNIYVSKVHIHSVYI